LYEELQNNTGWKCLAEDGDCRPQRLLQDVAVNIWPDRDANAQAANMTAALSEYERVTVYLSIPPYVFGNWSKAAVDNWGNGASHRVHVAAEKPFGTSLSDATTLHQTILDSGIPEANLHLVDHWLSFFMNKHLPTFRPIVERLLGISFNSSVFEKIVITEFETRGLDGRGSFFDNVGQVRDMVQSHLLQVMALALVDPSATPRSDAKLAIFNVTKVQGCRLAQYDGFLLEPKLTYHNATADATLCQVLLEVDLDLWKGVPIVIQTGKDMGDTLYTIEFYQRNGRGVMTYEIGKEETGVAGIKVSNWPLQDTTSFEAPLPGFKSSKNMTVTPEVNTTGSGYILNYSNPNVYFPKPYAMMAANLLQADYSTAFVTYSECHACWQVVTASGDQECLDPSPQRVKVYSPPSECGNTPPKVCFKNETVEYLYTNTFACTTAHDAKYANVSLYQAKCHSTLEDIQIIV
jgi:glucose-6-phosphate 1-dehydrogenase